MYAQLGVAYDPQKTVFIVSENARHEIRACIALYNYVPEERRIDWAMSSSSSHWPTCEIAACIIDYIFVSLNVHRLQAFTNQPEAEALLLGLGFTLDTNLTDWFGPGKDAKLYSLLSNNLEKTNLWEYAQMYYNKSKLIKSEGLH
jgi:hypothetical protein